MRFFSPSLLQLNPIQTFFIRNLFNNRCSVTKIRRKNFLRMYDTTLVFTDGSTIQIRYSEPKAIINLPILLSELETDEERIAWKNRRRKIEEYNLKKDAYDVTLNRLQYLKHFSK